MNTTRTTVTIEDEAVVRAAAAVLKGIIQTGHGPADMDALAHEARTATPALDAEVIDDTDRVLLDEEQAIGIRWRFPSGKLLWLVVPRFQDLGPGWLGEAKVISAGVCVSYARSVIQRLAGALDQQPV